MLRYTFSQSLLASSVFLTTTSVFAALQPIDEAPLSSETEFRCQFNADNSTDCVSTYSYTILKPSGRELLSRIDRSYAENNSLTLEKAELIQPGEKPVPLKSSQIDTRMAPNPDQGFLRERQISLAFPNLRVGTRINYTLREHFAAKPMSSQFHYIFSLNSVPVRYDRFDAEFTAERPIFTRSELMDTYHIEQSADKKKVKVSLKAPPYYLNYINEPDNGYLRRIPRLELGSSLNLQDNFTSVVKRYNEILAAKLPKNMAATVAINKDKPAAQQVAALMQYINNNYRYLGDWRSSERGHVPFSLAEIERNGYGDCKDLAIILTAMLRAVGIKAEPALVSRGEVAQDLLIPGMQAPNHAIVRAEVDGKTWWLDPTNPVFVPGRSMADIQQRWALVLGADGLVREDNIPLETPDDTIRVTRSEQYTHDGEAKIEAHVELSNMPLMQLSMADLQNGRTSADQILCRNFANQVSNCSLERDDSQFVIPPRYQIKASLTDLHALYLFGGQYIYNREDLSQHWDAFSKYRIEGQLADIYLGDPQTVSYDISLSGKFDEPAHNCQIRSPWFDIDLQAEPTKGGYHYRYREVQKVSWVSHDDINSDEFDKLIKQGYSCVKQLRLVVQSVKP